MNSCMRGCVLVLVLALFGCAHQSVKVDSTFWGKRGQKIGIAIAEIPTPAAYKAGAQGLLDIAINNAMAGPLEEYLTTVDVSNVSDEVFKMLDDGLRNRGQVPVPLGTTIKATELPDFKAPGEASGFAKNDLRSLAQGELLDAILLVRIIALGTIRHYYGFIPLDAPSGYVLAEGTMVSAGDNKLIWSAQVSSTKTVEGDWDEAPKYPNVERALRSAIAEVPTNISTDLFGSP